jgi:hypothetical protein
MHFIPNSTAFFLAKYGPQGTVLWVKNAAVIKAAAVIAIPDDAGISSWTCQCAYRF